MLKGYLDSIEKLFQKAIRSGLITREFAGDVALGVLVLDEAVDKLDKVTGESGEEIFTRYYYFKSLACAFDGKLKEGRRYFDKARSRRTGGAAFEWAQPFYKD